MKAAMANAERAKYHPAMIDRTKLRMMPATASVQ